ncbi:MAG: class I SAM-dependent methyltransferase [Chloroflexi bacterium]|nr:MAG: class I SAM-dependent methyltransferase [Chloroflexota bacterium]
MIIQKKLEIDKEEISPILADYDEDNYDYRNFWRGRDYEQWAETHILERLLERVGQAHWLVDLGGGFGRNAVHYHQRAEHAVIVDYSMRNLEHAATSLSAEIERGHIFLVRADLYRLPFVDSAFDAGLVVRVLHHLEHLEDALVEMGRIIGQRWILDIPIKHHILARARGLLHGETRQLSNWEPKTLTTDDVPFINFHLAAVRRTLSDHGWDTTVAASANNFRRWDQVLPARAVAPVRPLIYGLEMIAQTLGRGWWGPSQFVWATRHEPVPPATTSVAELDGLSSTPGAELATKMTCPVCRSTLQWSREAARCLQCSRTYPYKGSYCDFVPD